MDDIFNKIAKENNTTKEQVEKDILETIKIAMENAKGNPEAENFWKEISEKQNEPNTEEIIKKIVEKIIKENNKIKQQNSDGRF